MLRRTKVVSSLSNETNISFSCRY